jgi:tight adherence protein C
MTGVGHRLRGAIRPRSDRGAVVRRLEAGGRPARPRALALVETLGASLRARVPGLAAVAERGADRRLGAGVVAAVLVAAWQPVAGLTVLAGALAHTLRRDRASTATDERTVIEELPDVVDLLALVVAGGGTPRQAVETVGRHGDGRVARALARAVQEADRRGVRLADALTIVADELGDVVRTVVHPIVAAERYGTPLGPPLELVGRDLRSLRRQRAEERIRRVPVRLLFPLVLCTLPAFVLLTIVPLVTVSVGRLASGG